MVNDCFDTEIVVAE